MPGSNRKLTDRALLALLGAAALATLMCLLAPWHWFAELFSHFRVYYVAALVPLAMLWAARRRWAHALAAAVLAVPHLLQVVPYLSPYLVAPTMASEAAPAARIVAFNLYFRNLEPGRLLEYIERETPDVLVLSELTHDWAGQLAAIHERYPHRVVRPRTGSYGMGVYSRVPLADVEVSGLGAEHTANVMATLKLPGQDVDLYALHLRAPFSADRAARRNRQLDAIARRITDPAREARPVLVVGDLNLTPFSPHFDALLAATGLRDARRRHGLHFTWPAAWAPLWIPIDHCLAGGGIGVQAVRRGPDLGSDHYPLEIDVSAIG